MNAYLKYWKWFLLSLVIMLGTGYCLLAVTQSIYSIQASILIKNEQKNDPDAGILKELDFLYPKQVIENEIEVLKSYSLMKRVVEKLSLQIRYFHKNSYKKQELYNQSFIKLIPEKPTESLYTTDLKIEWEDSNAIRLNNKIYPVNQSVVTPFGQLRFIAQTDPQLSHDTIHVRVLPIHDAVQLYLKNIKISPSSKTSSIIQLSIEDALPEKGEDILDQLIKEYNIITIEDKNQSVANTLNFIKNRLVLVSTQVAEIEKSIENYKSFNGITDISADTKALLEQVQKNDIDLNQTNMQIGALADIENYINNKAHDRGVAPATLGLSDPTLIALISKLMDLELQRNNTVQTTSSSNPLLRSIDNQIAVTRENINESITSLKKILTSSHKQLLSTNGRYENLIRAIPGKERTLMNITRQQVIKNNLYTYLLQKQEEITLAYASTTSSIRLVDPPYVNTTPVKPNKQLILIVFFSVGLLIPALIIKVKDMIYERIGGRNDIEESVQIPIIGELVEAKHKHPIMVNGLAPSMAAEQIRALRTKLQLLKNTDSFIILITSSISGEGKSFLCLNLSASLALIKQPTVLLEMDFRKPDLHSKLTITNAVGLSDYLEGVVQLDDILRPIYGNPNLWLITCGSASSNPTELLEDPKLNQLFMELRQRFAYILVDAPPVGLVTDAEIIAPYADMTLYMVRCNVTPKRLLRDVDSLFKEKRLPRLNLVLNSSDTYRVYSQQYYKRKRFSPA